MSNFRRSGRTASKPTKIGEETWFLVQFEDMPACFRVLDARNIKHLDPSDEEEHCEGETVLARWPYDNTYYEAEIVSISAKISSRYSPPPTVGEITRCINSKCVEARRPKRVRVAVANNQ